MKILVTLVGITAAGFVTGSAVAQQQLVGTGQFCVKGPTGPIKCEYQTIEQCQQERPRSETDRCMSRSQATGTVGGPPSAQREQAPAPGEQRD
jgi:hypothetical protein